MRASCPVLPQVKHGRSPFSTLAWRHSLAAWPLRPQLMQLMSARPLGGTSRPGGGRAIGRHARLLRSPLAAATWSSLETTGRSTPSRSEPSGPHERQDLDLLSGVVTVIEPLAQIILVSCTALLSLAFPQLTLSMPLLHDVHWSRLLARGRNALHDLHALQGEALE